MGPLESNERACSMELLPILKDVLFCVRVHYRCYTAF
jgi:hypothetical protein